VLEAERLRPDLVVTDVSMPELNGIDAARQIRAVDECIRIVFLTMHADTRYAASAFEAGALGFVPKHSAPQELVTALQEAMLGRIYVSPMLAAKSHVFLRRQGEDQEGPEVALSPRQREVLRLLVDGKSAKEVASILDISAKTVEFHKYRMMELLKIKTSAELIQYAVRRGFMTF
jgi:DNA-binding NarL/FixJ family response regulator